MRLNTPTTLSCPRLDLPDSVQTYERSGILNDNCSLAEEGDRSAHRIGSGRTKSNAPDPVSLCPLHWEVTQISAWVTTKSASLGLADCDGGLLLSISASTSLLLLLQVRLLGLNLAHSILLALKTSIAMEPFCSELLEVATGDLARALLKVARVRTPNVVVSVLPSPCVVLDPAALRSSRHRRGCDTLSHVHRAILSRSLLSSELLPAFLSNNSHF